jgi:antirestriction protein ArdC
MTDHPRSSTTHPRADLYATVTGKIIAALERGEQTYTFPWHTVPGPPRNAISGRAYRGINTLLLWLTGHAEGYATPLWATFNQWAERGRPVRKGEHATTVIFWNTRPGGDGRATDAPQSGTSTTVTATGDTDATVGRRPFLARAYAVFNAAQVHDFVTPDIPTLADNERAAVADHFFANLPLSAHHGGEVACYRPISDTIHLPPFAAFVDANAYYATRAHESVHATGAPHRLHRDLSGRFKSETYAVEELVAELGAAFLCADLGLAPEPRPDHAAYIASWLKVLRGDTRAIFTAATHAQRAVDWLHAQQPDPTTPTLLDQPFARHTDTRPSLRLVAAASPVRQPQPTPA